MDAMLGERKDAYAESPSFKEAEAIISFLNEVFFLSLPWLVYESLSPDNMSNSTDVY